MELFASPLSFCSYGNEWKEKQECQNITAPSCDLTAETTDITELYHGRVAANGGKPVLSPRFCPMRDSKSVPSDSFLRISLNINIMLGGGDSAYHRSSHF